MCRHTPLPYLHAGTPHYRTYTQACPTTVLTRRHVPLPYSHAGMSHYRTYAQARPWYRSSGVYRSFDSGRRKSDSPTSVPRRALRPASSSFPADGANTRCERYDFMTKFTIRITYVFGFFSSFFPDLFSRRKLSIYLNMSHLLKTNKNIKNFGTYFQK